MKFRKLAAFLAGGTLMMVPKTARAEWIINGQVTMLPIWYTLEEALCHYMIGVC